MILENLSKIEFLGYFIEYIILKLILVYSIILSNSTDTHTRLLEFFE